MRRSTKTHKPSSVSHGPKAGKRDKYPILMLLVVSNTLAIMLTVLNIKQWRSPYSLTRMIAENPAGVGIVVQIISQLLGLVQVRALCILFNLSARLQLATQSLSLEALKVANALSCNRIDFTVRTPYIGLLTIFCIFNMLPAALWAGAITPVATNSTSQYVVNVPDYSNASGTAFRSGQMDYLYKTDALGTYTFGPELQLVGQILNNARDAFSPSGNVSPHAKLDKTGYIYQTRSYGVGSAVGLLDSVPQRVLSYQYSETGLYASAKCTYNDTSEFSLRRLSGAGEGWTLKVFEAEGKLPNGAMVTHAAAAIEENGAFSIGAATYQNSSYLALAAYTDGNLTSKYISLHKIQCQLIYTPYEFLVTVNTTQKTIHVKPQRSVSGFPHKESWVALSAAQIQGMAMIVATTQWTSILGDLFQNNVVTVQQFHDQTNANNTSELKKSGNSTIYKGVSSSVESMLDDVLQAVSAAQLMVLQYNQTTQAIVYSHSYFIGSHEYTYSVLCVNLLIAIIFIIEVIRTRVWRHAPEFDFVDLKAVILNAAIPGNRIAEAATQLSTGKRASRTDLSDDSLGNMKVQFLNRDDETQLKAQISHGIPLTDTTKVSSSDLKRSNSQSSNSQRSSAVVPLLERQPFGEDDISTYSFRA